jgi:putative hydrolase of the HAD superfamily
MTTIVVFDLDDTLYPERSFVWSGFRAVGSHVLKRWGIRDFDEACLSALEMGIKNSVFQWAYHAVVGTELTPEQAQELLQVYREHQPEALPWHADALETVQSLHGRFPLTLLSDGYLPTQVNKARALGLARWIDAPVFTESLGREHWKPSKKGFELIMSRHRQDSMFVYVGDNPAKDFIAPRALGWSTVQITRPMGTYAHVEATQDRAADYRISSLVDLTAVLRDL